MKPARRTLAIVALTTTLVSCSNQPLPATTPTTVAPPVRIHATTAVSPLIADLTTAYVDTGNLAEFDVQASNYQRLLGQLYNGDIPYFMTNYLPLDQPLWAAPVAQDAIALIAHRDTGVEDLSLEQLRLIYQGRITTWDAVGAAPGDIVVFSREGGSGTRTEFERMVMGYRLTTANARVASSSQEMIERIASVPGSIGYVSLGYINDQVTVLQIEGVRPDVSSVMRNTYALRSTVYVVGLEPPEAEYLRFLSWVQGPEGQQVVGRRYAPLQLMAAPTPTPPASS